MINKIEVINITQIQNMVKVDLFIGEKKCTITLINDTVESVIMNGQEVEKQYYEKFDQLIDILCFFQ